MARMQRLQRFLKVIIFRQTRTRSIDSKNEKRNKKQDTHCKPLYLLRLTS
nr:MAG TPA: hypothetical protein [Caudoviricetes sp.]